MTAAEWAIAGLGACVGVFLDRCVRRLAYEKSVYYPPRRHCPRCLQPLPALAAVPLVGRFLAGRRCRECREPLPWRGIVLQLLAAAAFVGLYRLHVVGRGAHLPTDAHTQNNFGAERLQALAVYHALLFCFLAVATTVDFELTLVPLSATALGSATGILLGAFWYVELHPLPLWFAHASGIPRAALWCDAGTWTRLFRWWSGDGSAHLPAAWEAWRAALHPHWNMNWNRYLGAATGIAGWLVGYGMVWAIDKVCSAVLGRDAMGAGDRDLLALIGAYLGWQSAVLSFFLAVLPGLLAAAPALFWRRAGHIPFGPHLAVGAGLCVAFWNPLFGAFRDAFLEFRIFLAIAAALLAALALSSALVRMMKGLVMAGRAPA